MTSRHRVTRTAIDLIKRFEGYRRHAAQLPDGRWTIGYGHTLTARKGAEVSEADAEALLIFDLIAVAHEINERAFSPLNQNQFDALAAFVFNIGVERFRHSTVLRRINEGAYLQAGLAMELWRRAAFDGQSIVVDALVRRRAAEKTLFLTPVDGVWTPAPSPLLPPQLDMDGEGLVPRQAPEVVTVGAADGRVIALRQLLATPPPKPYLPAEDVTPSPLQKAAVSVTSRLQAFFRTPERRPAAGAPAFELTPPEEEIDVTGKRDKPHSNEVELVAANEGAPDLFDRQFTSANDEAAEVARLDEPAPADEPTPVRHRLMDGPTPKEPSLMLLMTLAVCGLILFCGGLFWFFDASGGPDAGMLSRAVAWIAAFGGVAGFSVAAYLLLERLGRTAGDLGDI